MQKTQAAEAVEMRVIGVGELENGHGFYLVPSESDPTRYYVVEQWPARLTCTCKDHFFRHRRCKHIEAVVTHKAQLELDRADQAEASATASATCEAPHAPPARAPSGASRATERASDTALLRHNNQRPFSIWK